jgi:hypothetical protein
MKTKTLKKKLVLNKKTVVDLNSGKLKEIKGGVSYITSCPGKYFCNTYTPLTCGDGKICLMC